MILFGSDLSPTVHARVYTGFPLGDAENFIERTGRFMANMAREMQNRGCCLIGHIKCLVASEEQTWGYLSLTDFKDTPVYTGELPTPAGSITLTLNIIVYGVTAEEIEAGLSQLSPPLQDLIP